MNGEFNGIVSFVNWPENAHKPESYYGRSGMYYGQKWQCIEYVRRYFAQRFGVTFPSVDNVYHLWSVLKRSPVFRCFAASELFTPAQNDIVLMTHGDTGHVAIVVAYHPARDILFVADQNNEYGRYWHNEQYAYGMRRTDPSIFGWARLKCVEWTTRTEF